MNFLTFLFPYIETVTSGSFLRKFFGILYKVFGWFFFGGSIVAMLMGLFAAFKTEQMMIVLGSLFTAPILAAGGYLLLQISLYRSKTLTELTKEDYTAIPIVSIFLRYVGELYFAVVLVQGLIMLIGSLFVANSFFGGFSSMLHWIDLPFVNELRYNGGAFVAVLLMYVAALIGGVLVLLFSYLLAELVVVLAEIASNTRKLNTGVSVPLEEQGTSITEEAPRPGKCSACGQQNTEEDTFCINCGNKL